MNLHSLKGQLVENVGEHLYLAALSASYDSALVIERLNVSELADSLLAQIVKILVFRPRILALRDYA